MTEAIRVLVVDEDPAVRDLTITFLERTDDAIDAEAASGGDEALERLEDDGFDAVVSDLRMPGMDGVELSAAVRDRYPDLAIVLFSAADEPDTVDAMSEAAIDDFVRKGTGTGHYAEIVSAIRDALGN